METDPSTLDVPPCCAWRDVKRKLPLPVALACQLAGDDAEVIYWTNNLAMTHFRVLPNMDSVLADDREDELLRAGFNRYSTRWRVDRLVYAFDLKDQP